MRRAILILSFASLLVPACAVGSSALDGLVPDTVAGDGTDAAPLPSSDSAADFDAAAPVDSSQPDTNRPGADAGTQNDTGTPADTGSKETGSACPVSGFSGVLLTFDLTNEPGSESSVSPASTAKGITGGALSRGGALTPMSGSASINSSNWPVLVDPTRFYTFTITPVAGCSLSLTTLAVDAHASSSGPLVGDIATSLDNFASPVGTFPTSGSTQVSLAGVSGSAAIEVRVHGNGASSSSGTFRVQNTLTLSGSIN